MYYETTDMYGINRNHQTFLDEMRNMPADVASVENDWNKGIRTIRYKDGRSETRSISRPISKPSNNRRGKTTASELKASLKKTMRDADQNILDFIRRIAQLDVEISRMTMRGQYTGTEQRKRDDLMKRINQLEAVKRRCAALLGGA